MTVHFDFDESELKLAREALAKNGITNPEKQNERIKQAQETGKISIFAYGSLLHTVHTNKDITSTKAFVEGMSAKFTQAFTYYGGESGRPTLMLAAEKDENGIMHGAVQTVKLKSAQEFIEYYNELQAREDPVNNPIYQFNDTITVTTIDGQKIECITCLSNTNGPLHLEHDHLNEDERLTLDEQALILAHAMGEGWRIDNEEFRKVDGKVEGFKKANLQAHHLTGAAYVYHYLASYRKWGFPKNEHLETLVERMNYYRDSMYPPGKGELVYAENTGDKPERLEPRDEYLSSGFNRLTQEEVAKRHIAAQDKLNNILLKNPNYRSWDREWGAPNPYEAMGQKDPGATAPEHV